MGHLNSQALLTLCKPLMKELPDNKSKDMPKGEKKDSEGLRGAQAFAALQHPQRPALRGRERQSVSAECEYG